MTKYNEDGLKWCSGYQKDGYPGHWEITEKFGPHQNTDDKLQPVCRNCRVLSSKVYNDSRTKEQRKIDNGYQRSRVKESEKKLGFYVYLHKEGEEVVYVGKGKGDRAWSFGRGSKQHIEWMVDKAIEGTQWVTLHSYGLEENDALSLESSLIKEYQPRFNIHGKS